MQQQKGQKQSGQGRASRNNKKKHHATHEAGGHTQQKHRQNHQQQNNNAPFGSGFVACKICQQELQGLEKEFFPCNCKYKICQKCFQHHVDEADGKCPNCGLLYEVNRVKEYYTKSKAKQTEPKLEVGGVKKTRCESPQPSMTPASSLSIPQGGVGENTNTNVGGKTKTNKQAVKSGKGGQTGKNTGKQNQQPSKTAQRNANNSKATVAPGVELQDTQPTQQQQPVQAQTQAQKSGAVEPRPSKKQRNSSEQQRLQQKLSSVRILQRNTLYVIGLSPNVAKEDTLRRYEYFSQYGRIQTVTINKEKAFQSENQGLCFSAYINYANERDASLAILAVDQFVFDGRLLHASYGRTKYCRFFLRGTNCLNHDCPYLHKEAHPENILTQEDMNKKILFQQCQQLALKLSKLTVQTEEQFRANIRTHKDSVIRAMKQPTVTRIIMPQLEASFEKKGLFKHCIGATPAPTEEPAGTEIAVSQPATQPTQQQVVQPSLQQQAIPQSSPITSIVMTANVANATNLPLNEGLSGMGVMQPQGLTPDASHNNTFGQHRGSEGCNSEMQARNPNMLMFGGRGRLQSSGTLGELEFQNQNSAGQSRWQQLIPHGSFNQNRRFAHDDHYLTRVPPAFRLSTGLNTANPNQDQRPGARMNARQGFQQQQHQQHRFGSPHPPQNQLYFQQQFMAPRDQQRERESFMAMQQKKVAQPTQNHSDKATQQSSNHHHVQSKFQMSQVYHQQPMHYFGLNQEAHQVNQSSDALRARSGSQAATATDQFVEEAKIPQRLRRKSSHGKFRIFQEPRKESPSPGNKEEQQRFASALRQALQQFVKGSTEQEGQSTGQFSSIFAGQGEQIPNKRFQFNNCSEGLAGGRASSPIRESILASRRNSQDYGTLTRPRSQHSLIVESVARILDDTALEQGDRGEKHFQRHQTLNEPNFKTGPPSEVHQLMHEEQPQALNSHFESKWNNQFDLASSNSLNFTGPAAAHGGYHTTGKQVQKSQGEGPAHQHASQQQQQHQHTFTSPNAVNSSQGGVWNKSNSFYNSPFFLIPTHTSNQQHRSAAFHDHSLRHLHGPLSNPFSLGAQNTSMGARANGGGMVNDTWRLTYNPHPLLPRTQGGGHGQSSTNLSSAGGLFRNNTTTQSDQEQHQGFPMLSRTTSQPFMMRSEQKVIRGSNVPPSGRERQTLNNSQLAMQSSQMKQQAQLTQRNLEILNKKYCPSKDMLYAKIFTDFVPSSPSNLRNNNQVSSFGGAPQHPISVQHYTKITPQSLFCFALDGDDSQELRQSAKWQRSTGHQLKVHKQGSGHDATAGILSTPTRRKEPSLFAFGSGQFQEESKVKETSMTPTNKQSRANVMTWNEYNVAGDTQSMKYQQHGSGLIPREIQQPHHNLSDELEMANQLANEASLGFGDLISLMHSKSRTDKQSAQYAPNPMTRMSAVDGEVPPLRSRSQSYRDRQLNETDVHHSSMFEESERKQRRDIGSGGLRRQMLSNRRDSSNRSDSSPIKTRNTGNLAMNNQTSQEQSVATATTTGGQKNFYQEFVKVQEGFRKQSSGLISSSGFGATKVETRRSSYSQGRNSSNKTAAIQLMDVTRRGSFKLGQTRKSLIISPLGLLKFKNHQIDEVNEDGATALEEKVGFEEDPTSVRMNSADRQSYNLKTLKSVSRSRKASHSQNGNNFD